MNERWIEITSHFHERHLVRLNKRFETIADFSKWVDDTIVTHRASNPTTGMYFELRNWAGGDAFVGVIDSLWNIHLSVPEHPKLMFPLCDPSRSPHEFLNIQYIGERPLSEFLDRQIAIDSLEQWLMQGFVWLCPWTLFSSELPDY